MGEWYKVEAQHYLDGPRKGRPGNGIVRKGGQRGPERGRIAAELALDNSGAVAWVTRQRASLRWGMKGGEGDRPT